MTLEQRIGRLLFSCHSQIIFRNWLEKCFDNVIICDNIYMTIYWSEYLNLSSGYAYSFTQEPENIHIMRKWEGDDPGINNQKTPTILLLTPNKVSNVFKRYIIPQRNNT